MIAKKTVLMVTKRVSLLACSLFCLSGCLGNPKLIPEQKAKIKTNEIKVQETLEKINKDVASSGLVKAKGYWLATKSIPLSDEQPLPLIFNENWSFSFPGRLNLSTVTERITKVTGVIVHLSPDVFFNQSGLVGGGSGGGGGAASGPTPPSEPSPNQNLESGFSGSASASSNSARLDMPINYSGTLKGFLDLIAAQANVDWEYKDGQVNMFRMVTKTFTIKSAPGSTTYQASLGKTGNVQGGTTTNGDGAAASGGGNSSFSSSGSSGITSNYDLWKSMDETIRTMISQTGKFSINQATGSLTVTDIRENVNRIETYINKENSIMTRQVRLKVDYLTVAMSKNQESGVDWNVVYTKVMDSLSTGSIGLTTPSSLTTLAAGAVSFNLTAQNGRNNYATSAMLKALSQYGKASIVNSTSAVTLNRQPIPVSLTKQVGYLAQTTPGSGGVSGVAGAPGLTPGVVTTGFVLDMLPTVMDTGNILLQMSIDISTLDRLNNISSGSGESQQTIQTPEVSATQVIQRASIKAGQTLVVAGFDREENKFDRRSLTEVGSDLTGSKTGNGLKITTVIMITPIVEDGQ